jgi:thioesterase domain-containing protein
MSGGYAEQGRHLQAVLHEEIPLTRHIGITVEAYDGHTLRLRAPLENNINHKLTAFGGSLYSVAVLCGWGLLYLKMQERGVAGHIVIHETRAHYALPVSSDIVAETGFESGEQLERFMRTYQRKGRARVALAIHVGQGGQAVFHLDGRYVVHV